MIGMGNCILKIKTRCIHEKIDLSGQRKRSPWRPTRGNTELHVDADTRRCVRHGRVCPLGFHPALRVREEGMPASRVSPSSACPMKLPLSVPWVRVLRDETPRFPDLGG